MNMEWEPSTEKYCSSHTFCSFLTNIVFFFTFGDSSLSWRNMIYCRMIYTQQCYICCCYYSWCALPVELLQHTINGSMIWHEFVDNYIFFVGKQFYGWRFENKNHIFNGSAFMSIISLAYLYCMDIEWKTKVVYIYIHSSRLLIHDNFERVNNEKRQAKQKTNAFAIYLDQIAWVAVFIYISIFFCVMEGYGWDYNIIHVGFC
jgi:hypothetical protein